MSREEHPQRLTIKDAEGNEVKLPKLRRCRYVDFRIYLDVERDWRIIQLLYTAPAGARNRMLKEILRMVVNAAFLWAEKQPLLRTIKTGKKLTEEERRRLLRSKLSLV